jgi:hypothetical protein
MAHRRRHVTDQGGTAIHRDGAGVHRDHQGCRRSGSEDDEARNDTRRSYCVCVAHLLFRLSTVYSLIAVPVYVPDSVYVSLAAASIHCHFSASLHCREYCCRSCHHSSPLSPPRLDTTSPTLAHSHSHLRSHSHYQAQPPSSS